MANSLIVFSDGTANRGGVSKNTNVWRLYKMIDRRGGDQLTFYDDGVGTQDSTPYRALSGAFGLGITTNVMQAYQFIASNYEHASAAADASKIYLFGFSRGAYTVRLLLGLIKRCGLIDKSELSEAEFSQRLAEVREAFRSSNNDLSARVLAKNLVVDIEFIGVWDTVDAVGVPFDELQPVVKFLPRLCGKRQFGFSDRVVHGARVARHALAIDDDRRTFHPNYWNEAGVWGNKQTVDLRQVWFIGMHSNVGGGYPKDGLAYVTLEWMIAELKKETAIKLLDADVSRVSNEANETDKLYNSRSGLGVFYRYSPRRLSRFPTGRNDFYRRMLRLTWSGHQEITVHVSVWMRILRNVQHYAPLFINTSEIDTDARVNVAYTDLPGSLFCRGRTAAYIVAQQEFPSLPADVTRDLTRLVGKRQFVYALFLCCCLVALVSGLMAEVPAAAISTAESTGFFSGFGPWLADTLKTLVPKILEKVIDNAFAYPGISLGLLFLILVNYIAGRVFANRINSVSRAGWNRVVAAYFVAGDEQEDELTEAEQGEDSPGPAD